MRGGWQNSHPVRAGDTPPALLRRPVSDVLVRRPDVSQMEAAPRWSANPGWKRRTAPMVTDADCARHAHIVEGRNATSAPWNIAGPITQASQVRCGK
jgi:hypothetical protein